MNFIMTVTLIVLMVFSVIFNSEHKEGRITIYKPQSEVRAELMKEANKQPKVNKIRNNKLQNIDCWGIL